MVENNYSKHKIVRILFDKEIIHNDTFTNNISPTFINRTNLLSKDYVDCLCKYPFRLDKLDIKLLTELELNSRETDSKIAKKLKTSQQVINYRIKRLEEKKIIDGYHAVVDFVALGYTGYRVLIRFGDFNEKVYNHMIDYLMKHQNVLWIVECDGRWDLIVNFMAKTSASFNNMFKEFRQKFIQVQNFDILVHVEGILFGREYTKKTYRDIRPKVSFGGDNLDKKISYDKTDLKILQVLSNNARMNVVDISSKTGISINTVIAHIKSMRESKLIQSFITMVHLEKIPIFAYKALIKLQNITSDKEREIISYLSTRGMVFAVVRLIGAWDFEIEMEVRKKEELIEFKREFRELFKDVIKDFELLALYHEYKYNYFPGDIMDELDSK